MKNFNIFRLVVLACLYCSPIVDSNVIRCGPKNVICLTRTTFQVCLNLPHTTVVLNVILKCRNGYSCHESIGKFACQKDIPVVTTETSEVTTPAYLNPTTIPIWSFYPSDYTEGRIVTDRAILYEDTRKTTIELATQDESTAEEEITEPDFCDTEPTESTLSVVSDETSAFTSETTTTTYGDEILPTSTEISDISFSPITDEVTVSETITTTDGDQILSTSTGKTDISLSSIETTRTCQDETTSTEESTTLSDEITADSRSTAGQELMTSTSEMEDITFSTASTTLFDVPVLPNCNIFSRGTYPMYNTHGFVCSQYYSCEYKFPSYKYATKTCPGGQGYSIESKKCVPMECNI